jgi:LuxR family transcriptional regulator, quorum-sensing system regulator CciR
MLNSSLAGVDLLRIKTREDIRSAAEAFVGLASELGDFRIAPCHTMAVNKPMTDAEGRLLATEVFGWSEGERDFWLQDARMELDSPLAAACRYESEIFWCNADGFRSKSSTRYLDCLDLGSFERRTQLKAAIIVPVHLPFGQVGVVSYTYRDRTRKDMSADFDAHSDLLAVYARTFIAGYVRAICRDQRLPRRLRLSKREVECLHWASIGKTDNEIGMILNRSPATIRFHIHNVSEKLDAVNRSQTIFKAAQLGYIALAI